MSSVETSICRAVSVEVKPVRYHTNHPVGQPAYVFAIQRMVITAHDGCKFLLVVHLDEGCPALALGEATVYPTVEQVEGAAQ